MKILIAYAYKASRPGCPSARELKVSRQVTSVFRSRGVAQVDVILKHYQDLGDYIYEHESSYQKTEAITNFDRLDAVIIFGSCQILPWDPSCHQVLILGRNCYLTQKPTFAWEFGALLFSYIGCTGGQRIKLVHDAGGQALDELPNYSRPSPAFLQKHASALFLDRDSGDLFVFEASSDVSSSSAAGTARSSAGGTPGAWVPTANVGLRRHDLQPSTPHYRPKEPTSKHNPKLTPGKLQDSICRIHSPLLHHPLFQAPPAMGTSSAQSTPRTGVNSPHGSSTPRDATQDMVEVGDVPREFLVSNRCRWSVNASIIRVRVPSFQVLATVDGSGATVCELGNTVFVVGELHAKGPQYNAARRMLANFIADMIQRTTESGSVGVSARMLVSAAPADPLAHLGTTSKGNGAVPGATGRVPGFGSGPEDGSLQRSMGVPSRIMQLQHGEIKRKAATQRVDSRSSSDDFAGDVTIPLLLPPPVERSGSMLPATPSTHSKGNNTARNRPQSARGTNTQGLPSSSAPLASARGRVPTSGTSVTHFAPSMRIVPDIPVHLAKREDLTARTAQSTARRPPTTPTALLADTITHRSAGSMSRVDLMTSMSAQPRPGSARRQRPPRSQPRALTSERPADTFRAASASRLGGPGTSARSRSPPPLDTGRYTQGSVVSVQSDVSVRRYVPGTATSIAALRRNAEPIYHRATRSVSPPPPLTGGHDGAYSPLVSPQRQHQHERQDQAETPTLPPAARTSISGAASVISTDTEEAKGEPDQQRQPKPRLPAFTRPLDLQLFTPSVTEAWECAVVSPVHSTSHDTQGSSMQGASVEDELRQSWRQDERARRQKARAAVAKHAARAAKAGSTVQVRTLRPQGTYGDVVLAKAKSRHQGQLPRSASGTSLTRARASGMASSRGLLHRVPDMQAVQSQHMRDMEALAAQANASKHMTLPPSQYDSDQGLRASSGSETDAIVQMFRLAAGTNTAHAFEYEPSAEVHQLRQQRSNHAKSQGDLSRTGDSAGSRRAGKASQRQLHYSMEAARLANLVATRRAAAAARGISLTGKPHGIQSLGIGVHANAGPYESMEETRMREYQESKKKWVASTDFCPYGGTGSNKVLPPPPSLNVGTEYYPPGLHDFRSADKQKFVGDSTGWR